LGRFFGPNHARGGEWYPAFDALDDLCSCAHNAAFQHFENDVFNVFLLICSLAHSQYTRAFGLI
jgi:hypothetical protein